MQHLVLVGILPRTRDLLVGFCATSERRAPTEENKQRQDVVNFDEGALNEPCKVKFVVCL